MGIVNIESKSYLKDRKIKYVNYKEKLQEVKLVIMICSVY